MKALWSKKISLSLATFLRSVTEDQLSCAAVCVREWTQFPRGCLRRAKSLKDLAACRVCVDRAAAQQRQKSMPGVSLTFFAATYGIYPDEGGI